MDLDDVIQAVEHLEELAHLYSIPVRGSPDGRHYKCTRPIVQEAASLEGARLYTGAEKGCQGSIM